MNASPEEEGENRPEHATHPEACGAGAGECMLRILVFLLALFLAAVTAFIVSVIKGWTPLCQGDALAHLSACQV